MIWGMRVQGPQNPKVGCLQGLYTEYIVKTEKNMQTTILGFGTYTYAFSREVYDLKDLTRQPSHPKSSSSSPKPCTLGGPPTQ